MNILEYIYPLSVDIWDVFSLELLEKKYRFELSGIGLLVHICKQAFLPGIYQWLGGWRAGPFKIMGNCFPDSQQQIKASVNPFFSPWLQAVFVFYFTSLTRVSCGLHFSPVVNGVEYLCLCLWAINIFPPGVLCSMIFFFFFLPVFSCIVFSSLCSAHWLLAFMRLPPIPTSSSEGPQWNKRELVSESPLPRPCSLSRN